MTKKFIAGGCSFTFGHELSDDNNGSVPSRMTWAYRLKADDEQYVCAASPGSGNSGIARRVFTAMADLDPKDIGMVVIMWSFNSRYDWAMPRHKELEGTRWASISPWDTEDMQAEVFENLEKSNEQQDIWKERMATSIRTGVKPFAESLYKHAANEYHEIYLGWKSIIWLQGILDKKKIPYMFTLADNSLFYKEMQHHKQTDKLMSALCAEIDFTKWFAFGERMIGFNQWASLNGYEYATTHPLDLAHEDAVKLMLPTFNKLKGEDDVQLD